MEDMKKKGESGLVYQLQNHCNSRHLVFIGDFHLFVLPTHRDRFLFYCPGWLGTYYVVQAALELLSPCYYA